MSKTYEKAPAIVRRLIDSLLHQYHGELAEMKLKVDALLVKAPTDADGNPTGPALKAGSGYPAAASISIVKLKDRVMGRGDCEILIDGDRYPKWPETQVRAILDHELEHLEFTGNVDDIGRPKLKLRPHDIEFGWFDSVARRHGDTSVEVMQAKRFFGAKPLRQLYLPGWENSIPIDDSDAVRPTLLRTKAAALLRKEFGEVEASRLTYAAVPHVDADGRPAVIEAWVDERDRAVLFANGDVIDYTDQLQLSARWAKKGE